MQQQREVLTWGACGSSSSSESSGYHELKVLIAEGSKRAPSFPSGSGQTCDLAPCLCPSSLGPLAAAHGPSADKALRADQAGPCLRPQHKPAEHTQPALTSAAASGGSACQAVLLCWLPDHRLMTCGPQLGFSLRALQGGPPPLCCCEHCCTRCRRYQHCLPFGEAPCYFPLVPFAFWQPAFAAEPAPSASGALKAAVHWIKLPYAAAMTCGPDSWFQSLAKPQLQTLCLYHHTLPSASEPGWRAAWQVQRQLMLK